MLRILLLRGNHGNSVKECVTEVTPCEMCTAWQVYGFLGYVASQGGGREGGRERVGERGGVCVCVCVMCSRVSV